MKNVLLALMAMGLVASLGAAPAAQEVTGGDDLVEEKGPFQGTWIHPDANIMRFDKIVVWENGGHNGTTSTANFLQNMSRMLSPMMRVMRDIAGVELPESAVGPATPTCAK